ncbi:MAG: 2Fe-2S iron-sulfur cluster-binding protein [Pseudomonadales bacterium]
MSGAQFTRYRVVEKRWECEGICSLALIGDLPGLEHFTAGQHIVLRYMDEQGRAHLRSYSLSSAPGEMPLRISVKRETRAGQPPGLVSNWIADQLQVGDVLEGSAPRGDFKLVSDCSRDIVLLSCGVGITPVLSMLYALRQVSDRRIYFIYVCNSGATHPFAEEVRAIAAQNPRLHVHFCYKRASEIDQLQGAYHSEGLLDRAALQRILPLADYRVYLCGPESFMRSAWSDLTVLGIKQDQLHYEFFAAAAPLGRPVEKALPGAEPEPSDDAFKVNFESSATVLAWDSSGESLLDFAEENGIDVEYSCRSGVCNACATKLLSGSVEYEEAPLVEPEEGEILLCCAKPTSNITLEL